MEQGVLTSIDQVSPEWLTQVLIRSGDLEYGRVVDRRVEAVGRELSTIARLKLSYASCSTGRLPTNLLLKMVDTDPELQRFGGSGFDIVKPASEVNYYTRDYVGLEQAPILRCYDAAYSAENYCYHVLIEDCSKTHVVDRDVTPSLEYGLILAESLATMHARWLDTDKLIGIDEAVPTSTAIAEYMAPALRGLEGLLEVGGEDIQPLWRETIPRIYEHIDAKMVQRTLDGTGFTLVHGDVHPGNILRPIEKGGRIYLIDRAPFEWSLTTWLAVCDISSFMVSYWPPEARRALELPILRHYHQCLVGNRGSDYSWEDLLEDYRLTVFHSIHVATEWCRGEEARVAGRDVWLPILKRAMTAFFDLECDKLLE